MLYIRFDSYWNHDIFMLPLIHLCVDITCLLYHQFVFLDPQILWVSQEFVIMGINKYYMWIECPEVAHIHVACFYPGYIHVLRLWTQNTNSKKKCTKEFQYGDSNALTTCWPLTWTGLISRMLSVAQIIMKSISLPVH